jgi:hypothetical protein
MEDGMTMIIKKWRHPNPDHLLQVDFPNEATRRGKLVNGIETVTGSFFTAFVII